MKIVCDICNSTLTMEPNGEYAICESCGMSHNKERIRVILSGTSIKTNNIDMSSNISNWETLANSAFDNNNYNEAYTYYCKMLEVKVDYWFATYRKGLCLGWESTLLNIRGSEVLGGVVDATSLLLNDKTQSNELKANGIFIMAVEVFNWIQAINNLVTSHASEFAHTLVSSAKEFYEKECLVIKFLEFNLSMIDQDTYDNYADKHALETFISQQIETSKIIANNLTTTFDVHTGSTYNTFWERYDEVYELVKPDNNTLTIKTNFLANVDRLSVNLKKWSRIFNENFKKETLERLSKESPEILSIHEEKISLLESSNKDKKTVEKELTIARNKLNLKSTEQNDLSKKIDRLNSEIRQLNNKIFGKKKSQSIIETKTIELNKLLESKQNIEIDISNLNDTVKNLTNVLDNKCEQINKLRNDLMLFQKQNNLVDVIDIP